MRRRNFEIPRVRVMQEQDTRVDKELKLGDHWKSNNGWDCVYQNEHQLL